VEIIRDGPIPPHKQIADWLCDRINAGEFGPHERLPSESDLEQECGVARTTVRRTYRVLRDGGIAYTVHARGTFVSPDSPALPADRRIDS
jgi:DNA-binding GntR family transcriptional regulator